LILAGAAGLWLALPSLADGPGPGQSRAEYDARVRESKERARQLMTQGARGHLEAGRRWAATVRAARRRGLPAPTPGTHQRPAPINEDGALAGIEGGGTAAAGRLGANAVTTIPTNVRANDPTGDAANTTQAEQAIAARGNDVLVAWNDGIGTGGNYQGYGYSTDGGQTFIDGGVPPGLAGWIWSSDPVVTLNEKTGTFYYCGLVDLPSSMNGIGVVPATFSGSTLTWGTPVLVRSVSSATTALDKQWLVADSTNGNLYLTYSTFDGATGDHIDFQRSTNGGGAWTGAVQISGATDNGAVQGSRPAVGPAGELYATWSALGAGAQDFIRLRKSTNLGVSWGTEVTPVALYLNFGTGAPGFNRERGVDFPSIAVDRTVGPNRGRVYLTWTESINKYDDALNTLGNVVESENNDFFGRANPFTPGQRLRGALGTTSDLDCFSFFANQGTDYLFECDSIPNPLYTFRVFCGQDTTTRLAFSGDVTTQDGTGGRGYIIWSAPTTGTYYLRVAYVAGGTTGGYRISTGVAGVGAERGRDSRDVFASSSDNGTSWSTPTRVNDAAAYYDEYLPEVMVGADGMPYVSWFDWRDDGCGGKSYQYLSRSSDGGATWGANQRFSDVQNNWTNISLNSNLAPDQGDYSHMCTDGRYLRPAWADGRGGSPDVYTARVDTWHQISACQGDLTGTAGTSIDPSWTVRNLNPLLANTYNYTLTSQRSWPLPAPGVVPVAADATGPVSLSVAVPDTAAAGVNQLCLTVTNAKGTLSQSCCFNLTVQSTLGVPPLGALLFDLAANVPNPAAGPTRIDFSLPRSGAVSLRIFGLRGELVRTLVEGDRPAGPNTATWDGRDDHGRPVGAGAYFYRLEGFGQSRVRRLVWLR
jgi:hypothetical protein